MATLFIVGELLVSNYRKDDMSKIQEKIGVFAAKVIQDSMSSGLSWDESIAAFGLAAKALADSAEREGDWSDCCDHAMKRFNEGFSQPARLIFAGSDPAVFRRYYKEDAQAIFANANIKLFIKH